MKILSLQGQNDKELVTAVQQGESWALKKLFTDNHDHFMRWAKRSFQLDTEELQDIYQESVIITYENILKGKLNSITSSLSTYLFAVAKNLVREHIRREVKLSHEESNIIREFYSQPAVNNTPLSEALLESTKQVLLKLEEPCKSILTAFYYFNQSIEEIAQSLGYKDKTSVKTQKSRCLKYMRDKINFNRQ